MNQQNKKFKSSVTIDIIIPIALTFLISISVGLLIFDKLNNQSLEHQLENQAEQISISIQQTLSLNGDNIFHKRAIKVFSSNKKVVSISLYSISSNSLLISTDPNTPNNIIEMMYPYFGISTKNRWEYLQGKHYYLDRKHQIVHYAVPFYLKNDSAIFQPPQPSIIYIQMDAQDMLHQSEAILLNLALLFTPTLFISLIFVFLVIRRKAIVPAHQLLNVMSKQFHGDKNYYANSNYNNEFGELGSHLNSLLRSLRKNETELRRLSLVASNTDNAVIITAENGEVEWVNPGFERLTGYTFEEIKGKRPGEILQGDETDSVVIAYIRHAISMKEPFTCDIDNYKKDGSLFTVHIEAHPLYDEDDQFTGYMAIERDITKEKKYQDEIFRNNQIMKAFINHMHSGVLLETDDNQILHCNTTFCEIFGLTDHYSLVQSFSADKVINAISSTFAEPSSFLNQRKSFMKRGHTVINQEYSLSSGKDISIDFIPINFSHVSDTVQNSYLWQINDITQQKENENQLILAREQAEATNQYKSEFLAKMSHEIRTPLNAIMGFSHLLGKHELTDQQKNFVEKIEAASETLLQIINDILDFSKVEANKIELEAINFELDTVLERVLNISNVQLKSSSVQFFIDRDPNIPLTIYADPLRLEQVLLNLTNNAIKFTSEGEIELSIQLQQKQEDVFTVFFEVSDTGIGLSESHAASLFKEFNQADNSITRRFGGTGLGLAISQRLVNLMGGQISIHSQEGKGSQFSFAIPISIPANEAIYYKDRFKELAPLSFIIIDNHLKRRNQIAKTFQFAKSTTQLTYSEFDKLIDFNPDDITNYCLVFSIDQNFDVVSHYLNSADRLKTKALILAPLTTQNDIYLMMKESDIFSSLPYPCSGQMILKEICKLHQVTQSPIPATEVEAPDFSNLSFLLVEDNLTNQEVAIGILEETGAHIDVSNNGAEALSYLRNKAQAVDLVLMDIQMPVMGGYEATRRIRALQEEGELPWFPIIAITANAFAGEQEKVRAAGMDSYISKPFSENELFQKISSLLLTNPLSTNHKEQGKPISKENVREERVVNMNTERPNSSTGNTLESIAGLDAIQGIKNLGGREALYVKVLNNFPDESQKYGEGIIQAVAEKDQETLVRCAHSLKSILHHIGAFSLSEHFKQLEATARENSVDDVVAQTNDYLKELEVLTLSVQGYLSNQDNQQINKRNV